jgi:hypothetical protein
MSLESGENITLQVVVKDEGRSSAISEPSASMSEISPVVEVIKRVPFGATAIISVPMNAIFSQVLS